MLNNIAPRDGGKDTGRAPKYSKHKRGPKPVDFAGLERHLRQRGDAFLNELFPNGRPDGFEIDRRSAKWRFGQVKPSAGWVSLWCRVREVTKTEAARQIEEWLDTLDQHELYPAQEPRISEPEKGAQPKPKNKNKAQAAANVVQFAEAKEERQRQKRAKGGASIDWPDLTERGGARGRSQPNIETFLKHTGVTLAFDAMAYRTIVTRAGEGETFTDEVAKGLWLEADRLGLPSGDAYFTAVIENLARKASFHPVRDYLNRLEWDGVPRIDEWLHAYLGAEDSKLNSAYGRLHLIAAVRRVRRPGVKHDTILVLQGPQGKGKSSAIKALCPNEELFSDSLSAAADQKEIIEITAGKWLVEFAELDGMGKREAGTIKAMLSRQVDGSRLAYGRARTERPRQFVLFGTVNESHYLRDTTGNRRFWPVTISGGLDPDEIVANISRDRDQLWAEASYYEAAGESLVLPKHLWAEAARGQRERMVIDPWEERLSEELHNCTGWVSSNQIYDWLGIATERRNPSVTTRISGILSAMGYDRKQRRVEGRQVWGYLPRGTAE